MEEGQGLWIAPGVVIPESELGVEAARSGGPGGQNVNKVASKVVLRFAPAASSAFTDAQRARVLSRLEARLTKAGEIVIHSSEHAGRLRNLEAARARLAALLAEALRQERKRRPTRPTVGSKKRRLEGKRRRGDVKKGRAGPGVSEG